jgi:predicted nucleic acid-binding protein
MTMAWLFEDEKTKKSEEVLNHLAEGGVAVVPSLWAWEVSNVLLVAERRKRLTRAGANGFRETLKALRIVIDDKAVRAAGDATYSLAVENDLSIHDAAYLEIALRKQLPLATLDKKLLKAAKTAGLEVV